MQAQTAQVQIAGTNYPVTFADTNLSSVVRQRIASDLTVVASFGSFLDVLKEGDTEGYQLSDRIILFWDKRESVSFVDQNNQKCIQIEKPLSDKYLKIFNWMDTHTNAVQKAHEFVALLNSPDLSSKPMPILLSLMHFDPLSDLKENNPPSDTELRAYFETGFFPCKFLALSAQNFYFKEIEELDDTRIPLLLLFAIHKSDPLKNNLQAIGFYQGKWGFGHFPFPFNIP